MAKTFRTSGAGSQQTLHEIEDEKIPVYDTTADAEADLANLAEEQIVATKDAGGDEQTLIEYVDGRLETTTTEIAMDTFKTGTKAQLNKSGNNVQFRYHVTNPSTYNPISLETWTTIGVIPEELRPKQALIVNCQGFENNGKSVGAISLLPNGDVQFYREADYVDNFSIQCDYNVDGTNSHGMTVNTLKDAKDYTDARAVRKYDYTMTSTTSPIADIQALVNQLVSLGDNTYAGEFFRTGQTAGHYSISVRRSNNLFVNGTVTLGYDVNTASTWYVHRLNDAYHIRPAVINKNIAVSAPSTNPGNIYSTLLYQLQNIDWTFLTFHPIGTTATGNFELSGYYWGQYVATHHGGDAMTVTGTIDYAAVAHPFSAFYDASISSWKITIDGESLAYNANGLIVTSRNEGRTYRFICNRVPFNIVGAQLQTYGLWGRQALGRVGMEMNVALTYQDTDLIALTSNSFTWPAGSIYWWSNPTFQQANTSATTWPMYAQNDNHFYKMELWGSGWDQCYVSGGFEFTL